MERYSDYKDSGVKWLGEIPRHWEVIKTSRVFSSIGSGTTPKSGSEEYYTEDGIHFLQTGDLNDGYIFVTSKKITEKALRDTNLTIYPTESLIIAMYGATIGKLGILNIDSTVNQACCVLPYSSKIKTKYAFYVFFAAKKDLIFQSRGGGQPNISQDTIKSERIPIPPLCEQKSIVKYLDDTTAKIDEAIAQQRKMIDLLNERKQIIINNAVTKGLAPNVPMKDSGVEWIGEIPEHWVSVKTSYVFNHIGSGTTPKSGQEDYYGEEGTPFLQTGDLNDSYICETSKKITDKALRETNLKIYPKGSLVIAMYGATIGKLGVLDIFTTVNQACCVLPENEMMNTKYAFYYLMVAKNDLIQQSKGGGQPNISQETIRNEKFLVPPIKEQRDIAFYIDNKCNPINKAIEAVNKKITLLQERKQIIINDVVTGKVKVV